jgi:hypothetical protein
MWERLGGTFLLLKKEAKTIALNSKTKRQTKSSLLNTNRELRT